MPKFIVYFEQYVQEVATVVIEAETPEEALRLVQKGIDDFEIDLEWEDGSDTKDEKPTQVTRRGVVLLTEEEVDQILKESD